MPNIDLQLERVAEDLAYLRNEWPPSYSGRAIRWSAVHLRRLLIEDVYVHAWHEVGLEGAPRIEHVDLDTKIENLTEDTDLYELSNLELALAGGGETPNLQLALAIIWRQDRSEEIQERQNQEPQMIQTVTSIRLCKFGFGYIERAIVLL